MVIDTILHARLPQRGSIILRTSASSAHHASDAAGLANAIGTALFSFEGTTLVPSSTPKRSTRRRSQVPQKPSTFRPGRCFQRHRRRAKRPTRRERPKRTKVREAASNEVGGGEIFENCIEKNFHVSRHESGHQNLHPAEARASASRGMDLMVQFS
jgi:hypothetical protein